MRIRCLDTKIYFSIFDIHYFSAHFLLPFGPIAHMVLIEYVYVYK